VFAASGLYTHVVIGCCQGNGRSPHGYINQRLQTQLRAPDDELHIVGISTESSIMHGSMNIKFIAIYYCNFTTATI
jgi:hypothetical protein